MLTQGRIRDTPDLRLKTVLRLLVDKYDMPMTLSPAQSIVLRDILPKDKYDVEDILKVSLSVGGRSTSLCIFVLLSLVVCAGSRRQDDPRDRPDHSQIDCLPCLPPLRARHGGGRASAA